MLLDYNVCNYYVSRAVPEEAEGDDMFWPVWEHLWILQEQMDMAEKMWAWAIVLNALPPQTKV